MDPARTQLPAWKWIVAELKKGLNERSQDLLSVIRVSNKFTSLKKKFKVLYFDPQKTDEQKQKIFPFYTKMCDLFTDYATKHLHDSSLYHSNQYMTRDSQQTISESIQADVTSYVVQLLNEEDMDKTSLTILPYEEQENFSEHISSVNCNSSQDIHMTKRAIEPSKTETEKVRIKLAEIPSEALYIHKEKMRIDPNTPFNRHINSSTILNQRSLLLHNTQASSMKRKLLSDLEPFVKKKTNPIAHSSHRFSKTFNSDEYMIEALDECELSDITMRQSKAIYHDSTEEDVFQNESPGGSIASIRNNSLLSSNRTVSITLSEQNSVQSIVDVPTCPTLADSTLDAPRLQNKLSDTICGVPREIRPKKLNNVSGDTLGSSHVSLMKINYNQPPIWFQHFLNRYDSDIKNINAKLDQLLNKRESSPSPVLIHPKVLRIKRDSI